MANPHGSFIWYELMTRDPVGAASFYRELVGWSISEPGPDMDGYRMIAMGTELVGGMLQLTDDMCDRGARPVWLGYVGVDDVDETIVNLLKLGGGLLMPARDIPAVGRIAMVADPQGIPFYVMRGAVDRHVSTAFSHTDMGHCAWNELTTQDQNSALDFYGKLFGWENRESMPMGAYGDYRFLHRDDDMIGAVSPQMNDGPPPGWTFYFHIADIDAAVAKTWQKGGRILHGPHEIPGGEYIIIGADPEGATFALVGPRAAGND